MSALDEFGRLLEIMCVLRSPRGCPWDRQQTHTSLSDNLVEEVYEVLEAIEEQDSSSLKEELGDLLLHVVFHSQIASENEEFDVEEVIRGINQKLLRRHPHVFGEQKVDDSQEVVSLWEEIKRQEKSGRLEKRGVLSGIPKTLPALIFAQEVQKRAQGLGFDWENEESVLQKLDEEVREALAASDLQEETEEIGDVLFTLANMANRRGISLEEALRQSNKKFCTRVNAMEALAQERGRSLKEMSFAEQDRLWDEIKESCRDQSV